MHAKDLSRRWNEQRLYVLNACGSAVLYGAWTCRTCMGGIAYENRRRVGADEIMLRQRNNFWSRLVDLTIAVIQINSYNRINIAFGAPVALISRAIQLIKAAIFLAGAAQNGRNRDEDSRPDCWEVVRGTTGYWCLNRVLGPVETSTSVAPMPRRVSGATGIYPLAES